VLKYLSLLHLLAKLKAVSEEEFPLICGDEESEHVLMIFISSE
jgi:hypothetical protein